MDNFRLRLWAWLCVACFVVGFASCANAVAWSSQWSDYGASSPTNVQMNNSHHGSDAGTVANAVCAAIAGCHHVLFDSSGSDSFSAYQRFNQYNSAGGGIANQWVVRLYYQCTVVSTSWFGTASGSCSAPPDPCTIAPYAGASATGATAAYFDFGTDATKPGAGSAVGCYKPPGATQGCLAAFDGNFDGTEYQLVAGVKHFMGLGSYNFLPGASGATCTTDTLPDPNVTKPADTCKTGDVLVTINGAKECRSTDGKDRDESDKNNDGTPDSCHPGSWTTADGWAVTESWNAGTQTCTQTGTKAGQPNTTTNPAPGAPGPWTNPQPNGPGDPTPPGNPSNPSVPNKPADKPGDDMKEFCKNSPTALMCVKQTFGGTCGGGFTCTGDAVFCAMSKEQYQRNCSLFDNVTALSTLGGLVTSGADPLQADIDTALGKGVAPTDLASILLPGSEPLAGGCPAFPSFTVAGHAIAMSSQPYCDAAGYLGIMLLVGCTLIGARIVIGAF